jgi:hypothetical protein
VLGVPSAAATGEAVCCVQAAHGSVAQLVRAPS